MEMNVLIGGEAGQGAFSVELELTEMLSRLNRHFYATKNYMSRVRGGHNFHMLRIADHPVHALSGDPWDLIVALDEEADRRHRPALADGGIYVSPALAGEVSGAARAQFGAVAASNTMLVGAILAVLGVDADQLARAAGEGREAQLRAGRAIAEGWGIADRRPLAAAAGPHRKFDGNQALAFGAILGGCQFVAGYPMTPATSILHYIATASPGLPIHFEQAEDEIAAVNMALGASYAGLRAMTATSGGGFALMQEGVSLAGITETPIVIALSQRPGPATGLPTRTEQGDLNFVLHAGHGAFPRIILAPGATGEMIALTRRAFALADRYQVPVFVLTDQSFADAVQILEGEIDLTVDRRDYPAFGPDYRRYAFTDGGISPLTYPGLSEALVCLDSDEHDEAGRITEEREVRIRMMDKRLGKRRLLEAEAIPPSFSGDPAAPAVAVCWGSTRAVVEEAAARLNAQGIPLGVLHFAQVFPLTAAMVAPYGLAGKRLIGVENNADAPFAALLRSELGLAVERSLLKYDGTGFTVEGLRQALAAMLD